jgi:hypothetical protein
MQTKSQTEQSKVQASQAVKPAPKKPLQHLDAKALRQVSGGARAPGGVW